MKIYCLGDSLTAGYGVSAGECWRELVASRTGWELINGGVNGDTSGGMLARLAFGISARPDAIFAMGGGNDVVFDGDDLTLRRNFVEIFRRVRDARISLILGTPCPFLPEMAAERWARGVDFRAGDGVLAAFSTWLRDESTILRAPLVDFRKLFSQLDEAKLYDLFLDGVHLRPAGHRMMADLFCSIVKQFFRDV